MNLRTALYTVLAIVIRRCDAARCAHRRPFSPLGLALPLVALVGALAVFGSLAPAFAQAASGAVAWGFEAPPVSHWLREAGVDPEHAGIAILSLEAPPARAAQAWHRPAWRLNAERALNPASTMKLLTTWAALSLLGPEFRWHTGLYLRGPIVDGVLDGDLVWRGGGDPKFVIEDLSAWIAQIRAAGLREIRGDLVIDDSIFEPVDETLASLDGDTSQPYNVQPSGALMNFKATRFVVHPVSASASASAAGPRRAGRAGGAGAVAIELDPPLADVAIDNRIRVMAGPCRFGAAGLSVSEAIDDRLVGAGSPPPAIRVEGPYSASCGEQGQFAAVLDHVGFARAFFAAAWRAAGGRWDGRARIERGAAIGTPWSEWVSPRTLAEIVDDVNHFSNNVMARQLLLQLGLLHHGAVAGSRSARVADGRAVVVRWLQQQGLDFPELVLVNGSGLSRDARISADSLVRLLAAAAAAPGGERFRASLPSVGRTGTMRARLAGEPVAGHAWIKTGSLAGVRAIAGYVEAASGRRYAVAMFVNGPRAGASMTAQDRLIRWLHAKG